MSEPNSLDRLLEAARGHILWKTLGVYLVASWVALQVVDVLAQNFGLPDWFPAFAVALLVIGLPVILATAIVQSGPPPVAAAPDEPGAVEGGTAVSETDAPPVAAHRLLTWRNAILGGMAAFALWGVVAAVWLVAGLGNRTAAGEADSSEALRTVAVLPFDNLSTDEENAFFADGVHEDVLTQLSKIEDLTVISRTSVMGYRGTTKNLSEIGRELGAGAIVEGSVRRSGDNVRITAQLIDADSDEHLWADNFDRALTAANVFSIQSEIARRIAEELRATLTPEEASRIERLPTEDLDAYDANLRGRRAYEEFTEEGNNEAIELFLSAIERDPAYADPWAGLTEAYSQRVLRYGYGLAWVDSAEAAAWKALELEPELALAYKGLGMISVIRGNLAQALEANLRAIELDPNFAAPINNLGATQYRLGRLAESHRWYRRSFELQPSMAFARSNLASTYAMLDDFEAARRILDRGLAVDPQSLSLRGWDVLWFAMQGEQEVAVERAEALYPDARDNAADLVFVVDALLRAQSWERSAEVARESLRLYPDQGTLGWYHIGLAGGVALQRMGDLAEAESMLTRVLAISEADAAASREGPWAAGRMAMVLAALGRHDEALTWLRRAYEAGWTHAVGIRTNPVWDDLRDDLDFQEVYQAMVADVERMRLEIEREEIQEGKR